MTSRPLFHISEPNQSRSKQPKLKRFAAGIDLGTTHSLVGTLVNGKPQILANTEGKTLIPSVVRYSEDAQPQVGHLAQEALVKDPLNTLASMKRLLGRGMSAVKTLGQQLPYDFVTHDAGMPIIQTVSGAISPVQVASEILKTLLETYTNAIGQPAEGVVVTVPAYFDDAQRQATRDACILAKLPLLRLLNEPAAAAIAYGLDNSSDSHVLVYDLGGGTFDISLLKLSRGVFEVLATGGDSAMGGDDIDRLLATEITQRAALGTDISPAMQRKCLQAARQLKEKLSVTQTEQLAWKNIAQSLQYFSREQLEQLAVPLVTRSLQLCAGTLDDAKLTVADIDMVLLVGGATRMPFIQAQVADFFNRQPKADIDPELVVAMGAALQADILIGNQQDASLLLDVVPLSLGIEIGGEMMEKIIHRNTPIPVKENRTFTTSKDGQRAILLHVLQGEREMVKDCRSLGKYELRGIEPRPAGLTHIDVCLQVDSDGLLEVTARDKASSVGIEIEVKPSYGLTLTDVEGLLKSAQQNAADDIAARRLAEAIQAGELLLDNITKALIEDGNLLNAEYYQKIQDKVSGLRLALQGKDDRIIAQAQDQLNDVTTDFAALRMDAAVQKALVGENLQQL